MLLVGVVHGPMMAINMMRNIICTIILSLLAGTQVYANNLQLNNLNVVSTNVASNTMTFTLDLTQDNSWRSTINYDAAWVFMKYSTDGGITWKHASMATSGTSPAGFSAPSNFEIVVPADKKGFFVQRANYGAGNISASGVKFVWDYASDGLSQATAQAANTVHKVFGVEMVHIPQGAFYAGDGNSSSEYRFTQGSADNDPWYVQSENAITTTNAASDGYYYQTSSANGENSSGDQFILSASFPKGFGAFYMMKYELTEGQWVGFFNSLSNAAKLNHDITSVNLGGKNSDAIVNRNTIVWDASKPVSKATSTRPSRPVSYVSWPDVAAYAAWAGLRPLTELEFEKSARGKDIVPVADEFVWGAASYTAPNSGSIYPDANEEGSEIINSAANINRNALSWTSGDGRSGAVADGQKGPLRVGIFAANANNRISAGAGYYGAMELSGNLAEPVVTVGRSQGRQFLGTHGSGELTTLAGYEGYATNTDWPGIDVANANRGITGTVGIGYRGGDFQSSNIRTFQLSSRSFAAKDPDSLGYLQRYDANFGVFQGGRLGRSAP